MIARRRDAGKVSAAIATNLTRIGQYVTVFGIAGFFMALEHYVKYRLSRQRAPRATFIPGIGKVHLRPRSSDLATLREIFVNRDYDLEAMGLLEIVRKRHDRILAAGRRPLILDAGANIGLATRQFKSFFPEAEVVAVEPSSENCEVARLNIDGLPNVTLRQAALWTSTGTVGLNAEGDYSSRFVTEARADNGEMVASITPVDLFGNRADDLFLAKIDIEGSEARIFGPGQDPATWLRARPIMIIEGHDGTHNTAGSLAGILGHAAYRNGRINTRGPALIIIPDGD